MDASAAVTELVARSTQVVEVVVAGPDGAVEASHASSGARAAALARAGLALVAEAGAIRPTASLERIHVDLDRGSVVVVRDAERTIVATTVAEPTVGLVAHDLRAALRHARDDGT
jgi:hypothetical protein